MCGTAPRVARDTRTLRRRVGRVFLVRGTRIEWLLSRVASFPLASELQTSFCILGQFSSCIRCAIPYARRNSRKYGRCSPLRSDSRRSSCGRLFSSRPRRSNSSRWRTMHPLFSELSANWAKCVTLLWVLGHYAASFMAGVINSIHSLPWPSKITPCDKSDCW